MTSLPTGGLDDRLLPLLVESSIVKFDSLVCAVYEAHDNHGALSGSFLDCLLKFQVHATPPSARAAFLLKNYLVNNFGDFPKHELFERALMEAAWRLLRFDGVVAETQEDNVTDDLRWEVLSRHSLVTLRNEMCLQGLFDEACFALHSGNYVKAINVLHCVVLNGNFHMRLNTIHGRFLEQATSFLIATKEFRLTSRLTWELLLFEYAKTTRFPGLLSG